MILLIITVSTNTTAAQNNLTPNIDTDSSNNSEPRILLAKGNHGGHGHIGRSGGHSRGESGGHHHINRHHHDRTNLGLNFGLGSGYYSRGFYGSRFYGPGFYDGGFYGYGGYGGYGGIYNYNTYYPPTVIIPSTPPVYIQREPEQQVQPTQANQEQSNNWHYCRKPEGYYPYVRKCPGGWLQVAPHPAH